MIRKNKFGFVYCNGAYLRRMRGLTPKQKRFCELLANDPGANKTDAYREAFGKCNKPDVEAQKLWHNPRIKAHIRELMRSHEKEIAASSKGVLNELWRVGAYDPAEIVDDLGAVKSLRHIPENVRRAIESVTVMELFEDQYEYEEAEEEGQKGRRVKKKVLVGYLKKVKFATKVAPLNTLAKHFRLLFDDPENPPAGRSGGGTLGGLPPLLAQLSEEKQLKILKLIDEVKE